MTPTRDPRLLTAEQLANCKAMYGQHGDVQKLLAHIAAQEPNPQETSDVTENIWHPHTEEPQCLVGDRILGVVTYAERAGWKEQRHFAVLTATEDGWENEDSWSPSELDWWAYEKEALAALAPASAPQDGGTKDE